MRLVKIINLVRFNGDFIFVIVCDVLMLSKWCITNLFTKQTNGQLEKQQIHQQTDKTGNKRGLTFV